MEEEEICRVCRCGATSEQPLFHPCKCSGSIRHVHQDCLTEWLSHSRKKYCELCEHPFSFTPVYREDMPERLPWVLFIRQLSGKSITIICAATRATFVSCIWFVLIPYLTVWNWRFYLWSGENLAAQLDRLQNTTTTITTTHGPSSFIGNATTTSTAVSNHDTPIHSNTTMAAFIGRINTRAFWGDCFEGQMIACVVVILFAAAFLLREWLVQNIPAELDMDEVQEHEEEDEEEEEDRVETPPAVAAPMISDDDDDDMVSDDEIEVRGYQIPPMELMLQQPHHPHHTGRYTEDFETAGDRQQYYNSDSDDQEAGDEMLVPRGEPPNAPFMRHMDHHPFDHQQQQRNQDMLFEDARVLPNDNIMLVPNRGGGGGHIDRHPAPPADDEDDNGAAAMDINEMDEENLGDEIDGVLEVIGMRGSFWMLAQNSLLMTLLISLCLGIAIWMPYILGISFLMTMPFEMVNGVLWLVRKATDPVLDSIFYLCTAHIWPFVLEFYRSYLDPRVSHYVDSLAQHALVHRAVTAFREYERFVYNVLQLTKDDKHHSTHTLFGGTAPAMSPSPPTIWDTLHHSAQQGLVQVQPMVQSVSRISRGFATGKTGYDRFVCVAVGYIVIFSLVAWCHARSAQHQNSMFTKTFRQAVRQQSIILKVGMFITIELLLFPIVCGLLLDISSLPAFRDATISSRIEHLQGHPLASIFLHWFLGTAFMFMFAAMITMCRTCIRPGVLWFIRDPNDPQFHPIKEIVERPALSQLQKLGASSILYAVVIVSGVSTTAWCLQSLNLDVLPLRWHLLQPLSTIPIDFLVMHIAVPAMIRYLRPKTTIKNLAQRWMRCLCRHLRLSSYMLGERHLDEEGVSIHTRHRAWRRLLLLGHQHSAPTSYDYDDNTSFARDGQFVLAPKLDNIPYVPGRRMLVPVDPHTLQILDPVERELGHPAASGMTPDDLLTNTTVVYLPPLFKQRVLLFLLIMWTTSIAATCATTALPIVLGRQVYRTALGASIEIHDVYAYFTGAFLLVVAALLLFQAAKTVAGMWRSSDMAAAFVYLRYRLASGLLLLAKLLYIVSTMGLATPMLLGLVTEMYFVMPTRDYGTQPPTIELLPIWTRGFVCMSIIRGVTNLMPEHEWHNRINVIFQPDLQAVSIRDLTTKVVMPVMVAGLAAILTPFVGAVMLIKSGAFGEMDLATRIRFIQSMYPAAMVTLVVYYLCHVGAKFVQSWVQSVREDNYLVGTILHNFDN